MFVPFLDPAVDGDESMCDTAILSVSQFKVCESVVVCLLFFFVFFFWGGGVQCLLAYHRASIHL